MVDSKETRTFLEDYLDIVRDSVSYIWRRILKNLLPFLIIIGFFIALGFEFWYTRVPYYESDLVAEYNNQRVGRKTFGEMAHKLGLLTKNGSGLELGRVLGINPELTRTVVSIEAKNRAGSPLHEDITNDHQSLYFSVRATDRRVFAPLQEGLVRHLSNTEFQKKIEVMQLEKLMIKKQFLTSNLQQMDSMLDAYTFSLRNGYVFRDSMGGNFNIRNILEYRDELQERLLQLGQQIALESGPAVSTVHGFVVPDRPTRGSKKIILAMAILGVVAALLFVVIKPERKKLTQ